MTQLPVLYHTCELSSHLLVAITTCFFAVYTLCIYSTYLFHITKRAIRKSFIRNCLLIHITQPWTKTWYCCFEYLSNKGAKESKPASILAQWSRVSYENISNDIFQVFTIADLSDQQGFYMHIFIYWLLVTFELNETQQAFCTHYEVSTYHMWISIMHHWSTMYFLSYQFTRHTYTLNLGKVYQLSQNVRLLLSEIHNSPRTVKLHTP